MVVKKRVIRARCHWTMTWCYSYNCDSPAVQNTHTRHCPVGTGPPWGAIEFNVFCASGGGLSRCIHQILGSVNEKVTVFQKPFTTDYNDSKEAIDILFFSAALT